MLAGSYLYSLNGESVDIQETWLIDGDLSGECRIVSTRRAGDVELQVDATQCVGLVERFEVHWRDADGVIDAKYDVKDGAPIVEWLDQDTQRSEDIRPPQFFANDLPLFYPLLRVFTGPIIRSLIARGGEGLVLLPNIETSTARSDLLRPLCSVRHAGIAGEQESLVGEGDTAAQLCTFVGGHYDEKSRFWLAADNLLERYEWQQAPDQLWEVRLKREN